MKVVYIEKYEKFNLENLTIALGYFDGIHIAHKKLLNKTLEIASSTNTKSAILTFNMSAYDFINKLNSEHLTSFQDKVDIAMSMGFDYIIQVELSDDFIHLDYNKFIDIFLKKQKNIICGFDYSFGYKGLGNAEILKNELSNVTIIDCENIDNIKIGTRYIKSLLLNGEIVKANKLLGRTYKISGTLSKRNKFSALSTNNYFLVKSGFYHCIIKTNNNEFDLKIKLKRDDSNNLLIIKNEIDDLNKLLSISSISIDLFIISEIKEE